MLVKSIYYTKDFIRDAQRLPQAIQILALQKEATFRNNPLHPSLRLHALKGRLVGLWSISITMNYRIIFSRMENGDILFLSIGKHDIYRNL